MTLRQVRCGIGYSVPSQFCSPSITGSLGPGLTRSVAERPFIRHFGRRRKELSQIPKRATSEKWKSIRLTPMIQPQFPTFYRFINRGETLTDSRKTPPCGSRSTLCTRPSLLLWCYIWCSIIGRFNFRRKVWCINGRKSSIIFSRRIQVRKTCK